MNVWSAGKRQSLHSVAVMGEQKKLLFVMEIMSGKRFRVDSGSQNSLLPTADTDLSSRGDGLQLTFVSRPLLTHLTSSWTEANHFLRLWWDFWARRSTLKCRSILRLVACVNLFIGHIRLLWVPHSVTDGNWVDCYLWVMLGLRSAPMMGLDASPAEFVLRQPFRVYRKREVLASLLKLVPPHPPWIIGGI